MIIESYKTPQKEMALPFKQGVPRSNRGRVTRAPKGEL